MTKPVRIIGLLLLLLCVCGARAAEWQVDRSGRHLLLRGKPFFWLGDTVWLLAQSPPRQDVETYLAARQKQGFTVIQLTAVMSEERVWGTTHTNSFGDKPFLGDDPAKPAVTPGKDPENPEQYDYWDHLDFVLHRVHAHKMRAALVVMFVGWGGDGYKFLTPVNAWQYGHFLGQRYARRPELIWILGGDNTPETDAKKQVWNLVAKGITEGASGKEDYSQTFMTYHINGGTSSSEHWQTAPWLDFNMAQTWSEYKDIYGRLAKDQEKSPPKPYGLGEGAYEDGPQYPTKPIDGLVILKQACWSYFAGGYHTYGNGNVWHFDTLKAELTQPWKQALHSPGAESLKHLRKFFEQADWPSLVPDQRLLKGFEDQGANLNCAMRTEQAESLVFYLTGTNQIGLSLDTEGVAYARKGTWFNPATGEKQTAGDFPPRPTKVSLPQGWKDGLLHLEKTGKRG